MDAVTFQVYIYDSTMIAPFPLLFFGGDISVFVEEGFETVAVDGFIKFKSPTRIAHLVKVMKPTESSTIGDCSSALFLLVNLQRHKTLFCLNSKSFQSLSINL